MYLLSGLLQEKSEHSFWVRPFPSNPCDGLSPNLQNSIYLIKYEEKVLFVLVYIWIMSWSAIWSFIYSLENLLIFQYDGNTIKLKPGLDNFLMVEFLVTFSSRSCSVTLKSSWKSHQMAPFFIQKVVHIK